VNRFSLGTKKPGVSRKRRPEVHRSKFESPLFAIEYRAAFLFTFDANVRAMPITQLMRIAFLKKRCHRFRERVSSRDVLYFEGTTSC